MPVSFPASTWPTVLDERGPPEDPSILLTGTAHIGHAKVFLVAIRIDPTLRRAADFRPDVSAKSYQANGLKELIDLMLDDLDSLAGEFDELLQEAPVDLPELAGHPYTVWVVSKALCL